MAGLRFAAAGYGADRLCARVTGMFRPRTAREDHFMQYDFDTIIDRENNNAAKYDERARKFGTSGVIPLWVADMDFKTAQPVIDALEQKARQGIFGYVSRPASYYEALAGWQKRRNGFEPDIGLLSFSPGVVPSLSVIVHQFTRPGDMVLIQPPVYPEFEDAVNAWDRRVLFCGLTEKNGQYSLDFAAFEAALKKGPKLFILCHPHNPVGLVWKDEELVRMAELCARHNVLIVSDEIHSDLMLWGNTHRPLASFSREIAANVITCFSATKTFNLAGLQASAVLFPGRDMKETFESFWRKLDIMRNNAFSVVAMEAAWRHGDEWLDQLIPYLEGNMLFVRDFCKERIPGITANLPQCTYLVWLDCRALGMGDAELERFMVEKAGLGMNLGSSFGPGGEGYMRLNAACPRPVLRKALEQLENAVRALGA